MPLEDATMPSLSLEQRVAALEKQAAELKSQRNGSKEKPWLRSLGAFAGDEVMKEIFVEALKYRERDRARARRRAGKASKRLNRA